MKKLLLVISLIGLFLTGNTQPSTVIQFDKTEHNFGEIKEENGPVTCEFTFRNMGQEPYIISKVEASCGCTTPSYSKEPVKPGKFGFIKATYDPKNTEGEFDKLITVVGNTNQGPMYLTIKGRTTPRPRTVLDDYPAQMGNLRFPVNHIVLGDIGTDQLDTAYIKIYNPSLKKIRILSLKAPDHIWTKSVPVSIDPKQVLQLPFMYSAYRKNELGYVFDRIQLITDDDQMPEKELIVVANIKKVYNKLSPEQMKTAPKIIFDSTEHDFGTIKDGDVVSYEFKFKNTGKDPLIIYNVKSSCGCTTTIAGNDKLKSGEESTIKVQFNSKGKSGMYEGTITVTSNDPGNSDMFLTITAMVVITSKSLQQPKTNSK
jgi:hypothetical protein